MERNWTTFPTKLTCLSPKILLVIIPNIDEALRILLLISVISEAFVSSVPPRYLKSWQYVTSVPFPRSIASVSPGIGVFPVPRIRRHKVLELFASEFAVGSSTCSNVHSQPEPFEVAIH